MAYIRCGYGGGSVEVIQGTVTGSSGGTVTVTSQQGKTPKRGIAMNSATNTSYRSCIAYNGTYVLVNGGSTAAVKNVGDAVGNGAGAVQSVGSNSITFKLPTGSNFYSGTWTYSVEFE